MKSLRPLLLLWLLLSVGLVRVSAHDAGLSTVEARLRPGGMVLTTAFAPADAQALVPNQGNEAQTWSPADFVAAQPRLLEQALRLWSVRCDGQPLVPRAHRVDFPQADNISFILEFDLPPGGATVGLESVRLSEMLDGHRQYIAAYDAAGRLLGRDVIDSTRPMFAFRLQAPPDAAESATPNFTGFVRLGVEHIWTGYDHLLFLFGLLLVCRSFRSVVVVISCFTLAHSLTLALATLELVSLSPRIVEPLIAVSIVFVGVENLWRRGAEPKGRWALTFAFGLIHGFGFASVLRDLGVGSGGRGILMPLFTFNLGVELGQVAVAAVVLPIFWQLRKNEKFARVGPPVFSALIALAGLYWLIERLWLG